MLEQETKLRVAYVEDDAVQLELVTLWLKNAQIQTTGFSNGSDFLAHIGRDSYDCIVLDWELSDTSGIDILKKLKERRVSSPILFITLRDTEHDIVEALNSGADDYVVKPATESIIVARIKALCRRFATANEAGLVENKEFAPYSFDVKKEEVTINDKVVKMTHKEFTLALFLFQNKGRLISRTHILESIWNNHTADINTRTIDTHISRIRSKLELSEANGWKLSSIYLSGYRLDHTQ